MINVYCVYEISHDELEKLILWAKESAERYVICLDEEFTESQEPCVRRVWIGNPFGYEETFKAICWECVFLSFYFDDKIEPNLLEKLQTIQQGVYCLASAYSDLGKGVWTNLFAHARSKKKLLLAESLAGSFSGVPAIICGAGPSLESQLHTLQGLGHKALIISGGSAMVPLSSAGVTPHLLVGLDPDPPQERFYNADYFEIPFCYPSGFSASCAFSIHAPSIGLEGSGRYPLETRVSSSWGSPFAPREIGWNTVTYAVVLAELLGCSPIILVGVDLTSVDGKKYVSGVEDAAPCPSDWTVARSWLEEYMKMHPDTSWIHVWKGGLFLPAMRVSSLEEVFLDATFDIQGLLYASMQSGIWTCMDGTCTLDLVQESAEKSQDILKKLLEGFSGESAPFPCALWQDELESQLVYDLVLCPLWEVWKHVLYRKTTASLERNIHRILFFQRALTCLQKSI